MIIKKGIGKACGKMILAGEHSVLYGTGAIAVPVFAKVFTTTTTVNHDNKEIYAIQQKNKSKLGENNTVIYNLVKSVLAKINKDVGITLKFHSTIPNRSGLGSSAAMAVSVVRSIYDLFDIDLDTETLIELASSAEDTIHGKSSGIDVNVIARNEVLYFKRDSDGNANVRILKVNNPLSFILINTKQASVTKKSVESIREKYDNNPEYLQSEFTKIDAIVDQIVETLESKGFINYFNLVKILNENHKILVNLGLASKNESEIREILNKVDSNYAYKITGAGQGGYNFIFGDIKKYQRWKSALERNEYSNFQVYLPKSVIVKANPNIALIKYWGKRDNYLMLPHTPSLSVTLDKFETTTKVTASICDEVYFNGIRTNDTKIMSYLEKVRKLYSINQFFKIETSNNFPTAAGLASSASGFAALAAGINKITNLRLDTRELTILARLGSGSASRSIEGGVNIWNAGVNSTGSDSYSEQIYDSLPWNVKLLAVVVNGDKKEVSSTKAMENTVTDSLFYDGWKKIVERDMTQIKQALNNGNFLEFGKILERNAMAMHATLTGSSEVFSFLNNESYNVIQIVKAMRKKGIPAFVTADAGPNIKIVHLSKDSDKIINELSSYKTHLLGISKLGVRYE
jgi:diphosphomevalonate decarboxylase